MTQFHYQEAEELFPQLSTLIGGYMFPDMELHYDTCADAVAAFATEALPEERDALKRELDLLIRMHNQEPEAFHKYFGADINLQFCTFTFDDFVGMVRQVVDNPAAAKDYDF